MASSPQETRPTNMKLNVGKAGMESVNVDRVNEIILQASKGSNYYIHKQQRQKQIERKIEEMKVQLSSYTKEDIQAVEELMDQEVTKLESSRDLDHVIVHLDMDAFYAAVEIRDDPSLKEVPMAVGCQSMLSTSNYIARTFGVRAAMPGFIAKKICPQLVIVEPNFDKYIAVSNEVKSVLVKYDLDLCSMSLDEASLDISRVTSERQILPENGCRTKDEVTQQIVEEMRFQVFEKTGLTCSAGIACNTRLAKICSNMNKPNGQFFLPSSIDVIKKFMRNLPVAKVCGIGNVTEQQLNALGILTCGDLYDQRGLLHLLFSQISSTTFLRISLGFGSLVMKSDEPRKSMSVERTFKDTSNLAELKQWCLDLSKSLSEDLKKEETVGKLVTLKIKTTSFQTRTKAKLLLKYTSSSEIISAAAVQLLEQEAEAVLPDILKLRLMGVRMSTLINESEKPALQQQSIEDSVVNMRKKRVTTGQTSLTEVFLCPVCNFVELPEKEIIDHVNTCLDGEHSLTTANTRHFCASVDSVALSSGSGSFVNWNCPVCNELRANEGPASMNSHIDSCLSKRTVRQILRKDIDEASASRTKRFSVSPKGSKSSSKRCKFSNQGMKTIDSFFKT